MVVERRSIQKGKSPVRGFRMNDETYQKLRTMAEAYHMSGAEWLNAKINQEYEVFQGNPNMQKLAELSASMLALVADLREVTANIGMDELGK